MPRLTKTHYRRARTLAVSCSDNGQKRLRPDVFRDVLDMRWSGDLTGKQLDQLVAHAKWRYPYCFVTNGDSNATHNDQGAAPAL